MATPQAPPLESLSAEEAHRQKQYRSAITYTSWGAVVVCPLMIALPPRTLGRTSVLLGCMMVGANQLVYEGTGSSLIQRSKNRMYNLATAADRLPPKAMEMQARIREEKARLAQATGNKATELSAQRGSKETGQAGIGSGTVVAALEQKVADLTGTETTKSSEEKSAAEPVGWKAQRDAREKEALEDGRGYWGLITEQIWDVWSWGKSEVEEIKAKDEEVVKAQRESK